MINEKKFYFFSALFSLICFIVFNMSISATPQDPLFDDFQNFPDFPRSSLHYIIMYNSSNTSLGGYHVYFVDDSSLQLDSNGLLFTSQSKGVLRTQLKFNSSEGQYYWIDGSYATFYPSQPFFSVDDNNTIIASTIDIKNSDGDVFFFGMPLSRVSVWKTTTSQTLQQMFLITMAGLVKYLIVLLAGSVAFWKSWQLLLQQLQKA